MDRGMNLVHALSHGLTGGIGVKAAVDGQALGDQRCKPRWVRPGAGGGKATVIRMKGMATECVDSRLAENDRVAGWRGHGEEAVVFAGTGSHAAPAQRRNAAQLGADR